MSRVLKDLDLPINLEGKNVIDFGCGVGRLAHDFAKRGANVACVDQSVFHLRLAKEQMSEQGLSSEQAARVTFLCNTPDLIATVGGRRFDVVHSVIVLQHAVAPLQAALMQQMCDLLQVGGVGWLQVPHTVPTAYRRSCDLEASMKEGGMQVHATPMNDIRALFLSRGCTAMVVDAGGQFVDPKPVLDHRSAIVHFRRERAHQRRASHKSARDGSHSY